MGFAPAVRLTALSAWCRTLLPCTMSRVPLRAACFLAVPSSLTQDSLTDDTSLRASTTVRALEFNRYLTTSQRWGTSVSLRSPVKHSTIRRGRARGVLAWRCAALTRLLQKLDPDEVATAANTLTKLAALAAADSELTDLMPYPHG